MSSSSSVEVLFSFQGKSFNGTVTPLTNGADLHRLAQEALRKELLMLLGPASNSTIATTTGTSNVEFVNDDNNNATDDDERIIELKLLYKGKRIINEDGPPIISLFEQNNGNNKNKNQYHPKTTTKKRSVPKIMVMASTNTSIREVQTKRSDPTIRGLDQEIAIERQIMYGKNGPQQSQSQQLHWGEGMVQSKEYKFCRFEACTWQSFGHNNPTTNHHQGTTTTSVPHAFQAMQLLEKLATDPGIVAIMKERQLVVGTLGEMDPIDDRLMLEKQRQNGGHSCLLGYNTNGGARIDIKLRTDDLKAFRPYYGLAATLIHELSHNWVGDHNLLFWTNYAQMRAEYLYTHATLRSTIINGKTTAELAGLNKTLLDDVYTCIMDELVPEMAQHHGLHPRMIEGPIRQRINELEQTHRQGRRLGGSEEVDNNNNNNSQNNTTGGSSSKGNARELALAAAERRAREQQQQQQQQQKKDDRSKR